MHQRTESTPQEIKPQRAAGIERIPTERARPGEHASSAGKAEDMVALLADRMRRNETRR
jgi:hypothetical protein